MKDFKFTPPTVEVDPNTFKTIGAAVQPALVSAKKASLTAIRTAHLDGSALTPAERDKAAQLAKELDATGNLSDETRQWLHDKGVTWEV